MKMPWLSLFLLILMPGVLWARDAREDKRIEYLLQAVASLKGGVFVRNGSEYNASDAEKHLRLKLNNAGERVKTAEDFIEGCATRSSISGKTYKIRLPDGTTLESSAFLRGKLREFDRGMK